MKRILVVANRTLCEQHLLDELYRRKREEPIVVHIVVPASHPSGSWTEGRVLRDARDRLNEVLDTLAMAGIGATGEVGDESPVIAVDRALKSFPAHEIVVSTLPVGLSRWLASNAVKRTRHHTRLPVTHVMAEREPARV